MSFGDAAIDDKLGTARFPALSMVCGLLANAAGLSRREPARIQELQDGMQIASRLDRPGSRMRDYQTAGLNSKDKAWNSQGRVAERNGGASGDFTVQLEKEYLADASVTVAVSMPEAWIDEYVAHLRTPARPLFLGRRSCPPTRPILLGVVEAGSLLEALSSQPMDDGLPAELEGQWPIEMGKGNPVVPASDIKDWRNRVHVGLRRINEGKISVGARA